MKTVISGSGQIKFQVFRLSFPSAGLGYAYRQCIFLATTQSLFYKIRRIEIEYYTLRMLNSAFDFDQLQINCNIHSDSLKNCMRVARPEMSIRLDHSNLENKLCEAA